MECFKLLPKAGGRGKVSYDVILYHVISCDIMGTAFGWDRKTGVAGEGGGGGVEEGGPRGGVWACVTWGWG